MKTYIMNQDGQKALFDEIYEAGSERVRARLLIGLDKWLEDATDEMNRAGNCDETPGIEVGPCYSASGNPVVIRLDEKWFDVEEDESEDCDE